VASFSDLGCRQHVGSRARGIPDYDRPSLDWSTLLLGKSGFGPALK
jgi:hypothetical protein